MKTAKTTTSENITTYPIWFPISDREYDALLRGLCPKKRDLDNLKKAIQIDYQGNEGSVVFLQTGKPLAPGNLVREALWPVVDRIQKVFTEIIEIEDEINLLHDLISYHPHNTLIAPDDADCISSQIFGRSHRGSYEIVTIDTYETLNGPLTVLAGYEIELIMTALKRPEYL